MGPNAFDDLQRFQGDGALVFPGDVVRGERKWADAGADAALQAAFEEIVEQRGLIGEFHDFEMIFIEIDVGARRIVVLLHMVEESKLHEGVLTYRFLSGLPEATSCRTFFPTPICLLPTRFRRETPISTAVRRVKHRECV